MKALRIVLLSLGMMFLTGSYAMAAGQCDGKAVKACVKMKGCKWDKKTKACHSKAATKKAASKKAAPVAPKEEAMPADDESEMGEEESTNEY